MKKLVFVLITIILLSTGSSTFAKDSSKASLSINDFKWEYTVGDSPIDETGAPVWAKGETGPTIWLPCDMSKKDIKDVTDNYVWLKTTLPSDRTSEAALFIKTYYIACEVYLEGKAVYRFGDFKTINSKYSPGSAWKIIDLPDDYYGKTVYLRLYTYDNYKNGVLGDFELAPKSSIPVKIFKQDMDTVLLVTLFIFLGLCSMVISTLAKLKENKKSFLFLGLFSTFVGIWLLCQIPVNQYLFNSPLFWMYQAHITLYLMLVWLCLFLKSILDKKFALLLNILIICFVLYTLASAAGSLLRIFALPATMEPFHILLVLSILVITFMTIHSLFKGSGIQRTFGVSFLLLYIFIIIDIVRWYIVVTPNFKFLIQWAMFGFILIMAFSLVRQLMDSQNKLKTYSEEMKLTEEILEEKKRLLLEMSNYDKMKTDFFVNISHELRTPLNIILSTLQLINLYIDNGQISVGQIELPRHLKVMKQNCYRLIRLVNNVIDISKIDAGHMEPVFHRYDIVSAVEDTTLSAVDYIKGNGIELFFDTDIEEKLMCFDRDKVERIMLNLLSNAVKFSKPGSTIAVELKDRDDSVCISVKDTGIGIPEDTLQTIFERFVQADKSLTRSQEGSGIGLSLVKSLVEVHKGAITVESQYGKGSTFYVTLPCTLPETKMQESEKLNLPAPPVEKASIEFSDIKN